MNRVGFAWESFAWKVLEQEEGEEGKGGGGMEARETLEEKRREGRVCVWLGRDLGGGSAEPGGGQGHDQGPPDQALRFGSFQSWQNG